MSRNTLTASSSSTKIVSPKSFMHLIPLKPLSQTRDSSAHIACFLLKVAALEAVRRFSKARCPVVWKTIQALQAFCYPPLKWLQRWGLFKPMVDNVQKISRPLLVLSIATAFSDPPENPKHVAIRMDDPQPNNEFSNSQAISEAETNQDESDNWMLQLVKALDEQDIKLPERITEDEIQRFYDAANGDFSCLLSSLKKTIHWRETYNILSLQELEMWSHLAFWHGFDVMRRPCLVIRLGLACSSLMPHERPQFVQAVVSQMEYGVMHLIHEEDPRITVLLDCAGVSPLKFPMQMMRSCSSLVQDHYPNRLASLFVLRLPRVMRVLTQTFIQVLKPTTRKKLHVEGESYQKVLSQALQIVPAFLGGHCPCSKCERLLTGKLHKHIQETSTRQIVGDCSNAGVVVTDSPMSELALNDNSDHILRATVVAFLMLCILVAFIAGLLGPESISSLIS